MAFSLFKMSQKLNKMCSNGKERDREPYSFLLKNPGSVTQLSQEKRNLVDKNEAEDWLDSRYRRMFFFSFVTELGVEKGSSFHSLPEICFSTEEDRMGQNMSLGKNCYCIQVGCPWFDVLFSILSQPVSFHALLFTSL